MVPGIRDGLTSDRTSLKIQSGKRNCAKTDPVSKPAPQVAPPTREHAEKSAVNFSAGNSVDRFDQVSVTRSGHRPRKEVSRDRVPVGSKSGRNHFGHLQRKMKVVAIKLLFSLRLCLAQDPGSQGQIFTDTGCPNYDDDVT